MTQVLKYLWQLCEHTSSLGSLLLPFYYSTVFHIFTQRLWHPSTPAHPENPRKIQHLPTKKKGVNKTPVVWKKIVCGLWSELPPNRQRREVGAAKAAAPAAKSARASSKQRPQLTTPWRREALGARPPPGTNSPTASQRQPGVRKGGTPKQTTQAKPKGKPTKTWPPKGPQEGANENVTTSREGAHGRNQSKQGSQTKQKNTTATYWYTAVQIDCCTSINQLCTNVMSTLWFVTTQPYREDRNSAGLGTKRGRWTHSQATWSNVPSSVQLSQMQAVEG